MGFERDFLEFMPETVVVKHRASFSSYGVPAYTTAASTYRARVIRGVTEVRDMYGQTVRVSAVAYVASTAANTIRHDDRVQLPDGTTPPIQFINHYPDDDGLHHVKIGFGF